MLVHAHIFLLRNFIRFSDALILRAKQFFFSQSDPVPREKIFVAVKTCSKNHVERLPLIMKTWMKHVVKFGLFSNESGSPTPIAKVLPDRFFRLCNFYIFYCRPESAERPRRAAHGARALRQNPSDSS